MMNLLSARRARACGLSSLPLVLLASIASACSSAPPPDDAVMSSESVVGGGGLTPLFTGANSEFDDNVIADPDGTTTHVYAIRSADQTITHQWGDPTKSMPSETLGRIGSSLSVARSPSGADWYAESVGGDENVYVNHWGDWSWHGWYSVGTPPVSTFIQGPTRAAVAVPVGNVHVFAVGRDGNLWHRITTGSPTSQLE